MNNLNSTNTLNSQSVFDHINTKKDNQGMLTEQKIADSVNEFIVMCEEYQNKTFVDREKQTRIEEIIDAYRRIKQIKE